MIVAAYAGVLFLGAFLVFFIQPIAGKALLPWFGGAPAVWTTCLFFFQSLLLAGYACAHLIARLGRRRQPVAYLALLVVSLIQIPIAIGDRWRPQGGELPAPRILAILFLALAAPYVLLASTTPLMQQWVSRDSRIANPYRLYAISNAGSLLALLSYPFIWEPRLAMSAQTAVWSWTYGVFVVLAGALALTQLRGAELPSGDETARRPGPFGPGIPVRDRLMWFMLAASGSGLLAATTSEMCLDVAAVPFLWVLPLALYLVTFILAFAGIYHRRLVGAWFTVSVAALLVVNGLVPSVSIEWQVATESLALFFGAWLCHGEVARRAPDPRQLTAFYLMIAAGGAAGTLGALASPLVFRDFWELPLFLSLTAMLFLWAIWLHLPAEDRLERRLTLSAIVLVPALIIGFFAWPRIGQLGETVATARNFYGVLRVADDRPPNFPLMRRLRHGRILHGMQFLEPALRSVPTTYYGVRSGIERAIRSHPNRVAGEPLRIGVIGLGTGTIAAWGAPGDRLTFYEINPQVIDFAKSYFTFLQDSEAAIDVVQGDARLSLEQKAARGGGDRFDVLAVDAFSGDAIPVHLLTREASALYWRVLRDDGVLAMHIQNRHLDLAPVVRGLAEAAGKTAILVRGLDNPGTGSFSSNWILVSSNAALLAGLTGAGEQLDAPGRRPPIVWTDSFSNLYQVLR